MKERLRPLLILGFLFTLCSASIAQHSALSVPENENWDDRFGPPGVSGEIRAVAVSGDNIYVGGDFIRAGSLPINRIARWNMTSHRWFPLGSGPDGVDGSVMAITVDGDNVYVGGQFTFAGGVNSPNIAVYNSVSDSWSAMGGGAGGDLESFIAAIAVKGSDIYVGGNFATIGTTLTNNIARWDGTKWRRMEGGANGRIFSLTIVGNDLYAGGDFTSIGSSSAGYFARWDGTLWSAVANGPNGAVHVMTPDGNDLYVGGAFTSAGSVNAENIVRLNMQTQTWSALGNGLGHTGAQVAPVVNAIVVTGNELYAGGNFRRAGNDTTLTRHIARWDGSTWTSLHEPADTTGKGIGSNTSGYTIINAMTLVGDEIYIGGRFDNAYMRVLAPDFHSDNVFDGYSAFNIVRWSRSQKIWRSLGDTPNDRIGAMSLNGSDLYVGGRFSTAGGVVATNIVRWNSLSDTWFPLGNGIGVVRALANNGNDLYAAVGSGVTHWNGSIWSDVGSSFPAANPINTLALRGTAIYAGRMESPGVPGGAFKWDGSTWSPLGGGVNGTVYALAVDGDDIYVGGEFTTAGGVPAMNIARWNETSGTWSALGSGVDSVVYAVAAINGRVYVGGGFLAAGGIEARHIAQWSKSNDRWDAFGPGLDDDVRAIALREGMVVVGGEFLSVAGAVTVPYIALWDGEVWSALGSGTDAPVFAVVADANAIYAAGTFVLAGDKPSFRIARWSEETSSTPLVQESGTQLALYPSIPNPFSSTTMIRFFTSERAPLSLRIIDALGRPVATLFDGEISTGEHSIAWNADGIADGLYFCRLQSREQTRTTRLVVRK